jgi:hypothetical protein
MQFICEKNENLGKLGNYLNASAYVWVKMTVKMLKIPMRTLFFRRPVCNNISVQKIGN